MNNHQKSIFYPSRGHYKEHQLGNFLNPLLAGLRVFLKSFQIDKRWRFDDYSFLCKGLV